ncbi:MAG: hypothetical protein SAK29_16600 [Scytonema sp. PMC 1069.18]|nr:hypothetical protein [Scytonema sp. PMC 1069.18]MEC4885818.1 hypothetical protein [Scytonema sp. PMC 1070.18]
MPPSRRKKSEATNQDTKELQLKEVAVKSKFIDSRLISQAEDIEKQNPNLSVLAARQFCCKLLQIPVEVVVSREQKFNVLEEFILRASIEFTPPPTVEELANVLGLDTVFVKGTADHLESLKILEVSSKGEIHISHSGLKLYNKGSVPVKEDIKEIYAIVNPFQENITFQFEPLPEETVNLPDLAEFVLYEYPNLEELTITDIQQLTQSSALGLHIPEEGKMITNFQISGKPINCWRAISIFILLVSGESQYKIQLRQGPQILEKASNWLTELEFQQKVCLKDLCQLTEPTYPVVTRKTRKRKSENK